MENGAYSTRPKKICGKFKFMKKEVKKCKCLKLTENEKEQTFPNMSYSVF